MSETPWRPWEISSVQTRDGFDDDETLTVDEPIMVDLPDPIDPPHYTGGTIEACDAILAMCEGMDPRRAYLAGQVMKYIWRHMDKGKPAQDLGKAQWYLDKLKEEKS